MMTNKIFKSALAVVVASPLLLTSCIEEPLPTDVITDNQLAASPKANEALLWEMSAIYNKVGTITEDAHYDWGQGSLMHIRDVMTGDMAIVSSNYDHYSAWEQNQSIGPMYMSTQFIWNYFWKQVQTANNALRALHAPEEAESGTQGSIAIASAQRASMYLDIARMYEFLPNDIFSGANEEGNDVTGLTVPIIDENTTEEDAKNNPRASREQMAAFILNDLDVAEKYISNIARLDKTMPDLGVVYGLKARYYMWLEDYPKAAEYARKAINLGYTVTTQDQWTSTTTGFNTLATPSWMWGMQVVKEDRLVTSGIINWTSWMCSEAEFGYAYAGPMPMVDASMYERISDTDFRKLSWVPAKTSPLASKVSYCNGTDPSTLKQYVALKFRPGQGNIGDYQTAAAVGIPLMRVEEMYFIEAEAIAHSNPGAGKDLLVKFMQDYRDPNYSTTVASVEDVVEEIVFQKRVELWGEGHSFFDYKRLNMSVTRSYPGTNFAQLTRFNTDGRPAWMNICIVQTEGNSNAAIKDWNNPDPSGKYTAK